MRGAEVKSGVEALVPEDDEEEGGGVKGCVWEKG